jgi:hypothetical protein
MHTRSCPSQPANLPQPQITDKHSRGQVLVIFAATTLVLLFFIGLAVDAGSLYISYGQLKRGVDSAAIAAANNFKRGESLASMYIAAQEVLRLQNIDMSTVNLAVHICDEDGNGETDPDLATISPEFFDRCPASDEPPRKLVWVRASVQSPFYFLSLLGFSTLNISSFTISEAAPVDLVLVLDVSESMGYLSSSYNPAASYNPNNTCNPLSVDKNNSTGACQPLWNAKDAASQLISNTLYSGYDRVSIITFDSQARVVFDLTDNLNVAQSRLWSNVILHDDPYVYRIWPKWLDQWSYDEASGTYVKTREFLFNPVNPEDRDGDGLDYDNPDVLGYSCPDKDALGETVYNTIMADRWWDYNPTNDPSKDIPGSPVDPHGWGGVPCDEDDVLDSYDWDGDGVYTPNDTAGIQEYFDSYLPYYNPNYPTIDTYPSISPLSTCTGCGLRMASNELKQWGRPGAVWVVVLLSDGDANLSDTAGPTDTYMIGDTPNTGGGIPSTFANGFCNSELGEGWWLGPDWCKDTEFTPRYCLYVNAADDPDDEFRHLDDCPSDSTKIWVGSDPDTVELYSVVDYARDIADSTARENELAIYTIGLNVASNSSAEKLLRYIAWVGDDPLREAEDPCRFTPGNQACGQYYFATQNDLRSIFDDIASRIYTKISE